MRLRLFGPLSTLFVILAMLAPLASQAPAPKETAVPRTPDGRPDLQGVWNYATRTPLQRPKGVKGKTFTDEEAAAYLWLDVRLADVPLPAQRDSRDPEERRGRPGPGGELTAGNVAFGEDRGEGLLPDKRSSLVIDPPDGRVPPLTPEASKRASDSRAASRRNVLEGPEDAGGLVRCITGNAPPTNPFTYNNHIQLVQTRDTVVILSEIAHNAKVVPLDGRPHLPPHIRLWDGDSVGRWDGDTLVVETTNFTAKKSYMGSSENMRLVERYRRVDATTMLYEYTVHDPTVFTKPWTVQLPMTRTDERIYEYACHEGNYAMGNMLRSSRAVERRGTTKPRRGTTKPQ
jgi:hypothetical protein